MAPAGRAARGRLVPGRRRPAAADAVHRAAHRLRRGGAAPGLRRLPGAPGRAARRAAASGRGRPRAASASSWSWRPTRRPRARYRARLQAWLGREPGGGAGDLRRARRGRADRPLPPAARTRRCWSRSAWPTRVWTRPRSATSPASPRSAPCPGSSRWSPAPPASTRMAAPTSAQRAVVYHPDDPLFRRFRRAIEVEQSGRAHARRRGEQAELDARRRGGRSASAWHPLLEPLALARDRAALRDRAAAARDRGRGLAAVLDGRSCRAGDARPGGAPAAPAGGPDDRGPGGRGRRRRPPRERAPRLPWLQRRPEARCSASRGRR